MIIDLVDNRVLGAVNFVDATTSLRVLDPLNVTSTSVLLRRNRSGYYVVIGAPGFEAHIPAFQQPPTQPPLGTRNFTLQVVDPARRYLSRRFSISLPRNPDPAAVENSLFIPITVPLYPAPSAPVGSRWAVIRATVVNSADQRRLGGALIRVVRKSDLVILGRGLSDMRGEALIAVAGIPITTWDNGGGAVVSTEVEVNLQVVFDPTASGFPNPDDLETQIATLLTSTREDKLKSGRVLVTTLSITLP